MAASELPEFLLEILVDPTDKGPLYFFAEKEILYNPRARVVYEIRDNIPVLLVSEARSLTEEEAAPLDVRLDLAVETGGGSSRS